MLKQVTHTMNDDKQQRARAVKSAITKRMEASNLDFTEDLGEWISCLFPKGHNDAEQSLSATVALLAHFADNENVKKLPEWLQAKVGQTLYRWHEFFCLFNIHGDALNLYIDNVQASYYGSITEQELQELEKKYLKPVSFQCII